MDLRHLRCFLALAEERQFTAAARKMNIVQSGLSITIKELEQELGVQLVNRSTRKVSLTAAGEQFLEHARSSLGALETGIRAVRADDGIIRGQLRLGVLQSLTPYVNLPNVIAGFLGKFPEIEFSIRSLNTPSIPAAVRDGEADLSFHALLSKTSWPGLTVTPFTDDRLVAISSLRHPLAKRRSIAMGELESLDFVDLTKERALRTLVDQIFSAVHAHRKTVCEVSDVESLLGFVAANLGMAIVPSRFALCAPKAQPLSLIRLVDAVVPLPTWRIVVLTATPGTTKQINPAVRLFLNAIQRGRASNL